MLKPQLRVLENQTFLIISFQITHWVFHNLSRFQIQFLIQFLIHVK